MSTWTRENQLARVLREIDEIRWKTMGMSEVAFMRDLKTRHEIEKPLAAVIEVAEAVMQPNAKYLCEVDLKILSGVGAMLETGQPVEPSILWSVVNPRASFLDRIEVFALREVGRLKKTA